MVIYYFNIFNPSRCPAEADIGYWMKVIGSKLLVIGETEGRWQMTELSDEG
jgi:hypothetical protein